jgi:hypothetical protein
MIEKLRVQHHLALVSPQSGFTNQALVSIAFSRELGQAPSIYRRSLQELQLDAE